MRHYSLREIEAFPTLHSGQFANLKVDTGQVRVWLSRMTIADGEKCNNLVSVEVLFEGRWETTEEYEAE